MTIRGIGELGRKREGAPTDVGGAPLISLAP